MLYVTHDQEEAITLGDRVVVMRDGHVLQVGTPLEIYGKPATRFVGGFVGSPRMNFLRGDLETRGAGTARVEVKPIGLAMDLPWQHQETVPSTGREDSSKLGVIIGFRPEDVRVVEPGGGDLDARVDVVEPLGREDLLHLVPQGGGLPDPGGLRALADPTSGVSVGTVIGLRLKRESVHLFEFESEVRLG